VCHNGCYTLEGWPGKNPFWRPWLCTGKKHSLHKNRNRNMNRRKRKKWLTLTGQLAEFNPSNYHIFNQFSVPFGKKKEKKYV
jgi:hypothetical protein